MRQADGTLGYPQGLKHGVTGKGANDYDQIFQILKSVNYQGWVSIEDGMNGMEEMKESIEFLKRMRTKYF
jgi:sugar phosphate isomerase/epimerase